MLSYIFIRVQDRAKSKEIADRYNNKGFKVEIVDNIDYFDIEMTR